LEKLFKRLNLNSQKVRRLGEVFGFTEVNPVGQLC